MAVNVSLAEVALHVLGKGEGDLDEARRATLDNLRMVACETVEAYVKGSPTTMAIRTGAVLRYCYYDFHTRLARRPADGGMLDARFRRDAPLDPFRSSGAMALVSPWKQRGVGLCS